TFMDKYNPDQFEIIGVLNHGCDSEFDLAKPTINGKDLYSRILIRRKK
ncbi:MAG: modification methylase, partial [Bacteroidales bacterium]|nr:modification methylase [Bacteroidales bacterium]